MKKLFISSFFVFLLCFFLLSCVFLPRDPQVKFLNSTSDIYFGYGLRVGDAEFTFMNRFIPGDETAYKTTPPGRYPIQAMTRSGSWLSISSGRYLFEEDKSYIVTIYGSSAAGISIAVTLDDTE